jgi:hypothetical protein
MEPPEVPKLPPDAQHTVEIRLGAKRYELVIMARADEIRPERAEVIEMPKREPE